MTALSRANLAGVLIGDGLPVAVMGVLNVSPESFHPGSVHATTAGLLAAALAMVEAGATLIDVGARSTAPYLATAISDAEETARLARAVEVLAGKLSVPVSADTSRPEPARAALEAGARIINDVCGLADPAVARLVAGHGAGVILMASPKAAPAGGDPVATVRGRLAAALAAARAASIPDDRVALDPGIGFFRDTGRPWHEWDACVLRGLGDLAALGRPLCVGVSRKSFVGAVTGRAAPAGRLAGSLAATAVAVLHGAALVRTHDVADTVDAVRVAERLRPQAGP
ncbi:MAG TPA: dihydropteroate synthase [Candidatus Limnocylindria bacterium]|nr:dihydropteroate synthase [Candidatus Limnocylindria bacterium]